MNDQPGHGGVTTNGTSTVTDAESLNPTYERPPSLSARPLNAQSVDERLEALMEVVRTWDWRAVSVEARPAPALETTRTVSDLAIAATAQAREDLQPLIYGPSPVECAPDTQTVALEPTPPPVVDPSIPADPTADTQKVVLEPTPPPVVDPSVPADPDHDSDDTGWPSEPEPRRGAGAWRGPVDRLWAHPRARAAILILSAAVVVFLIIWGIRLADKSPGASAPPPTTAPRHAAVHTHHKAFVAPIPAAQLAKYQQFIQGLQTANAAATGAFVGAGSTPTATQLAPAVAAYRSALNLYYFQLHFIQWPASMQPAITVELAQLSALVSFLQSISYVSPTGMSAWLSQLHARTGTAQTADNQIRLDLGLPSSASFPT